MLAAANAPQFTLTIPNVHHDFKVLSFKGTEAISELYAIHIELVSEDPDFDLERLLSQPAFLQFGLKGEGLHGHIEEVVAGDPGKRLTHYRLALVPALHYLQFSFNQRIFQHLTVPQIVTQVLQQHGLQTDVFTFHVRTSAEREYCTQYGESDFEFIQRLCAEDGIAWHYQHSPEGHLLVFTEDPVFFRKLDATPFRHAAGMVAEHPVVSRFAVGFRTRTSTVTRRHYDLQRPTRRLENRFTEPFRPELEDYRYLLLVNTEKQGKQLVRQALERHRRDYELAEGTSNQPTLRSGHLFDLTEHRRKTYNDLWLLLSVTHHGKQPQSLEEAFVSDDKTPDGFTQGYRNSFSAIPSDVCYRPPMPVPRPPLVSQTARVTGPAGEEIYCDEYGRVKVEFHWDRTERNSEHSSCWLRVASSWAGDGFGAVTIPRIGMEVVVTFQEGDPDQPLIIGCVANKVMSVAHSLPQNKTRTVLRSHSSPPNGGYNELSIEDRAGLEKIYLRAQRDLEQLILNNSHCLIKGDESHTTHGVRSTVIGADEWVTIDGNSSTTCAGSLVIQAGQQAHVTALDVVIDGGRSLTLKAGGHHLLINAAGIFSSVAIAEGGAPLAGVEPLQALPVSPDAGKSVAKSAPASPEPLASPAQESDELEEEEEEVEEEGITLRIGVFFDGTGNNRSNSETVAGCHARDVNLQEEAEDIQRFCQQYGYGPDGSTPDNSFGNDTSNVAKLYELYTDDSERQLADDETIGFISVYLEGIGTRSGGADVLFSQATGVGEHGVLGRVKQSPASILEKIDRFAEKNPDRKVEQIEFDIFGFSRGAAGARHFANEVQKGERSPLAALLAANATLFASSFSWCTGTDVSINFIGIFDTAAAVAGIADGDLSVHDAINPGVNLYLAPDIAKKVVHLVAKDERRHNFSLNSAGAADIRLPGAHSDLGGGYVPNITERVLLSRPRCSREVDLYTPSTDTYAFILAQNDLGRIREQLHLYGLAPEVKTWSLENHSSVKGDRYRSKTVYAAVHSRRIVRNDLALIYLRIMRELAARHGVPFKLIAEDQKFALRTELKPIAQKLMAYALGETRSAGLSRSEEALLYSRYIHLSAHWNAAKGWNNSDLDIIFIDRPAENHARVVHPNA